MRHSDMKSTMKVRAGSVHVASDVPSHRECFPNKSPKDRDPTPTNSTDAEGSSTPFEIEKKNPTAEKGDVGLSIQPEQRQITYLHGLKLHLLSLSIWTCIFLANIEISIVSTSLVTITNAFNSFDKTDWIVTSYLITYTSFLIIWAKLGDIFGRKYSAMSAVLLFVIASGACGAARTMDELIIFRAFQGIGGAGAFSSSTAILYQMVPSSKMPIYGGGTFAVVALATVLGPLLGGVIDTRSTWRWIFLINVPLGAAAILLMYFVMPATFPYHGETKPTKTTLADSKDGDNKLTRFERLDLMGAFLILAATLLLVSALLQSSVTFKWSSPAIIVLLVLSGICWMAFFGWEWYLSNDLKQEPMFPWRFAQNRVWMGMLCMGFFIGVPMTVLTIVLPQKFQAVNADTPLRSGVRLLAFSVAVPLGSLFGNVLAFITKKPAIIFVGAGSAVQLIGISLMSTIPSSGKTPHALYAYEAITGFGAGSVFSILMLAVPKCIDDRDIAVGSSAIIQFRMMGSAIGVAIAGSIVDSYTKSRLSNILSSSQLTLLLRDVSSISTLPKPLQIEVRETFGEAYNIFNKVLLGLAIVQVILVGLLWRRPQLPLH